MNSSKNDLSYFSLRLREVLQTSFPEKTSGSRFVEQRAALAAAAYEEAFRSGNPIDHCHEIAINVLFEGLHFSKFDAVFQVVCNEFDALMADEELRPFALKMLPVCAPVFSHYELTDDFAYGFEYDLLYTELTGTIALWIDKNGLQ